MLEIHNTVAFKNSDFTSVQSIGDHFQFSPQMIISHYFQLRLAGALGHSVDFASRFVQHNSPVIKIFKRTYKELL